MFEFEKNLNLPSLIYVQIHVLHYILSDALQGDHVTFLNVYKGFLQSGKSPKWCNKNFVNYQAMVPFWAALQ